MRVSLTWYLALVSRQSKLSKTNFEFKSEGRAWNPQ